MEPFSLFFHSHRLKLHYWDYNRADGAAKPPLILVHGGLDHSRSWDFVAQDLVADYHVFALDLRGHGDSQWAPGALYTVAEHVTDLAALCDIATNNQKQKVTLIGHSLGGLIVMQYAAAFPEAMEKLVNVEAFGSPLAHFMRNENYPEKLARWIKEVRKMEWKSLATTRTYPNLAAAVERMREANPHLSEKMAIHLTLYGMNQNADGSFIWKFDPFLRSFPPYSFDVRQISEVLARLLCPILLVRGGESWSPNPQNDEHFQTLRSYEFAEIPKAGHWVQHDQLKLFTERLANFLRGNA